MAKPTFAKDKGKKEPAADLAQPQTIAARAYEVARPHAAKVAAVLGGVVLVVIGLIVYTSLANRKAAKATDAFGKFIDEVNAKVEEAGPDIELVETGGSPSVTKPKYKTFSERAVKALELRKTLDLGSTKVAENARLVEAALLYDTGKYDDALVAYRAFLEGNHDPFLVAQAREGVGYALEAKALGQSDAAARNAGLDEALQAFVGVAAGEKEPHYSVALYHQARIRVLKGDKAGAIVLFKRALQFNPTPQLTEEINNRVALLEAK